MQPLAAWWIKMKVLEGNVVGNGARIAIVAARFNEIGRAHV